MWSDEVAARGSRRSASAAPVAARTYRLTGIGESQVAELLGETVLRGDQSDRRDLRPGRGRRRPRLGRRLTASGSAEELVEAAASERPRATSASTSGRPARRPGATRSARGSASSAGRCDRRDRDRREPRRPVRRRSPGSASTRRSRSTPRPRRPTDGRRITVPTPTRPDGDEVEPNDDLVRYAHRARELGGSQVGLAVRTRPRDRRHGRLDRGRDAVGRPAGRRRIVFLTGPMGRSRVGPLRGRVPARDPARARPHRVGIGGDRIPAGDLAARRRHEP